MTRLDQSASRLSLRNSILVWVAGIVIGWGCAVVLFYQLIRDSAEDGRIAGAAMIAESRDAMGVADIEPAAGPDQSLRRIEQPDNAGSAREKRQSMPEGS
ncbi:MAG TPA: hypothetical protein VIG90_17995 [Pedomonas sp.]|uniref:hypothetical protein n=1 Tax=Pedomonas sp. TaxID=2976421 RepID=UPI002F4252ED